MSYPARQTDPTKPYKLRIYVKSGVHKGDLKRQEYFSKAWQLVNGEWLRMFGY